MKTLTLVCVLLLTACSSSPTDIYLKQINAEMESRHSGTDPGYEQGNLEKIANVNAAKAISDLELDLKRKVTDDWEAAITYYTQKYKKSEAQNDIKGCHMWKWEVNRMQKLRKMKPKQTEYSVYKYIYLKDDFKHIGTKREVTAYYFFDGAHRLIGHLDENEFNIFKSAAISSETHPYHMSLLQISMKPLYHLQN